MIHKDRQIKVESVSPPPHSPESDKGDPEGKEGLENEPPLLCDLWPAKGGTEDDLGARPHC
jgi:hypothetical protein